MDQLKQDCGVYCPISGYLYYQKVIDGLVSACLKLGGTLCEGVDLNTISQMDNSKYHITCSEGIIGAKIIINCAGANAGQFGKYTKSTQPFTARHHELLIVRPEQFPENSPMILIL